MTSRVGQPDLGASASVEHAPACDRGDARPFVCAAIESAVELHASYARAPSKPARVASAASVLGPDEPIHLLAPEAMRESPEIVARRGLRLRVAAFAEKTHDLDVGVIFLDVAERGRW